MICAKSRIRLAAVHIAPTSPKGIGVSVCTAVRFFFVRTPAVPKDPRRAPEPCGETPRPVSRPASFYGFTYLCIIHLDTRRLVPTYISACSSFPKVSLADEAIRIGPAPALESYLKAETILEAAGRTGAQARCWLLLVEEKTGRPYSLHVEKGGERPHFFFLERRPVVICILQRKEEVCQCSPPPV